MNDKKITEKLNNNYAWVTLIATNDFIPGAILMQDNLKKVNSKYPLFVIVTNNITKDNLKKLEDSHIHYKKFPYLSFRGTAPIEGKTWDQVEEKENFRYWDCTLSKFYIYTFTEFDKVAFIDADIEFLDNCDEYFDNPVPSMFLPPWEKDCPHGSVFIVKPSYKTFWKSINIALEYDFINDEQVLKVLYPTFNLLPSEHIWGENQKMYHHDGPIKPWMKI